MNFPRSRQGSFLVSIIVLTATSTLAIDWAPDLMGSYCGSRKQLPCCTGRSDSCSVPILGTLCYCDEFCRNATHNDCCPDYEEVCHHKTLEAVTKPSCYFDGQIYRAGESFRHNCNSCTCSESGNICCDQTLCVTDASLIKQLNGLSQIIGWSPANHTKFWGKKFAETLKSIADTSRPNRNILRARKHTEYLASLKSAPKVDIPLTFDARYKWPGVISKIADQGWCNTAWALATVDTANDRIRLLSKSTKLELSVEEMIDCSRSRQSGCYGSGQIDRAWNYLKKKGLHSARHYRRETAYKCSNVTTNRRRYRSGPMYLTVGEKNIQEEIMTSGPVQATMRVYRDFFSYGSGIYRSTENGLEDRGGFLAVRIIGWGFERGVKYWLAANAWGTEWGEDGYFRIRRGTNECGIENFVFAAWGSALRQREPTKLQNTGSAKIADGQQFMTIIAGPSGRRKIDE